MSSTATEARPALAYRHLCGDYSVGRLPTGSSMAVPAPPAFFCLLQVDGQTTVYCASALAPAGAEVEAGWALLELDGSFGFDVTGVMASWTAPLAEAGIPIMALSSFATDYLLLKHLQLEDAHRVLEQAGFVLIEQVRSDLCS